ncbi:hypothetical protein [uncultured Exiguobacterium sp.]|uniref:hypothetical protein n=1 Tax=uncultured Exiguobacterium sp. TaxID=202669 RepID=UPI003747AECD
MLAFFIVFKNMYHVLRILFKQQEQQAVMGSVVFLLAIGMISALIANFNRALRQHHGIDTPPKKESNE